MFRASSRPTSGAQQLLYQSLVILLERDGSSAVGRGRVRPRPTALLPSRSDGKPEAATAVVVAPDDGHEDARNMLS
jgi:hypothetical protein